MERGSDEANEWICRTVLDLIIRQRAGTLDPDYELDMSRAGGVIGQVLELAPDELRPDLLILRDALAAGDDVGAEERQRAVQATVRLNRWMEQNCDLPRLLKELGHR